MFDVLKIALLCFTMIATVVPIAFLFAMSMPHNSELRRMFMQLCYWGSVILAVGYFALPFDFVPDLLFPVGLADDAVALGLGLIAARKAIAAKASLN